MTKNTKCVVVVAAFAIASTIADAGTIAWYHFDEVAAGTRLVSGGSVLNAVDSTALRGQPYSVGEYGKANYVKLGDNADFMPMATNDVADTVYVVDPIGGTTIRNERSLYFTYADDDANNKPARYGGCVQVASDSSLSLANVTVEFFVRPMRLTSRTDNGWHLVGKQSGGTGKFTYSICLESAGKPYVNCYDSSGTLMSTTGNGKFVSSRSILDGRWHHVAFTASGTTAKLYVDHNLEKTVTLTSALYYVDDAPLYVGASQMGWYVPGGFIDEVRISDSALDPASFLRYVDTDVTHFHAGFERSVNADVLHTAGTGGAGAADRMNSSLYYPAFTNDVPDVRIDDGSGNVLYETNSSSLYLAGGCVKYPHNVDLEMPEMTVECFLKYVAASNYANIVRFSKSNDNWYASPIWSVGFSGGELFMRIDPAGGSPNQTKTFGNTFLDGKWHHLAITFQQVANELTVRVYDNRRQVGVDWTLGGALDYGSGSILSVGLSGGTRYVFYGFIDEVRISRGVLPVEAFMRSPKKGLAIVFR